MESFTPCSDLTRRPPRSARARLGGYVILPRIIDKGRATAEGTQGEYKYGCPLDMQFFDFAKVAPEDFKQQIHAGLGDGDLLQWVLKNTGATHGTQEITDWSRAMECRIPSDDDSRDFFQQTHKSIAPERSDIKTWFDLLDLDDYASYGDRV